MDERGDITHIRKDNNHNKSVISGYIYYLV